MKPQKCRFFRSDRLGDGLFEHGLDDVDAALHEERQDDAVADFAPAAFSLCLLFRCVAEIVDGILDHGDNFGEKFLRDVLLDLFRDIFDINSINDVVPNFCPFAHDNTHPFSC